MTILDVPGPVTPSHLAATPLADFRHPSLVQLVDARGWRDADNSARIGAAYTFVKDEIPFGYNRSDDLPASAVLADGYGQCNTKGTLLVALLRALAIPCRVRGFTIDKALQRGAIPEWMYPFAPSRILHSWVEVHHEGAWTPLEGFILDDAYLHALQRRFADVRGPFCGYGVATKDLHDPPVTWCGRPTYIQREGIVDDFGVFDSPDALYAERGTNLRGLRRLLYAYVLRHAMNRVVRRVRLASSTPTPALVR
ncbi:MAG: transglutaminase [Sandaracinus sp.]|nr:hypothetical protein [Myxococcales bacterium]MCB9617319.1 transglutaminase [Sandaracinus sp.]